MDKLFKYIRKRDGKFVIENEIVWGRYDNIEDALYDRDVMVDSEWDLSEALARDEKENKYRKMDIPSFDDYLAWKNRMKYITKQKSGSKEYYVVQKKMNGVIKRFGYFKTLDEAIDRRNKLMDKGWFDESRQ